MRVDDVGQSGTGLGARLCLALLSWPFLLALAVLLFNDHYLKAAWPGFISGKLSDVAGIFGVGLVCFAARADRPWLIAAVLFASFLWWKSPASQPFIDAVVSLGWPRISRTVDYTDLGAFVFLPLAWRAAGRLQRLQVFDVRVRRFTMWPVLMTSAFAVAATSPPEPVTYIDDLLVRLAPASPGFKWSEVSAAVDAAAEKHGMRTRNWKPNAERVRYERKLMALEWGLRPDGSVTITVTGYSDHGFLFSENIEKVMGELNADLKREFRWRFDKVDFVESTPSPRVIQGR